MRRNEFRAVGIAFLVLAVAGLTAIAGGSGAGQTTAGTPATAGEATVTTSATERATAAPDRAVIRVAATAVADDPAVATDALARNVSRLRSALAAENISREAVRTVDYSLADRSDRPPDPPSGNETRYRAEQTLAIEVADVGRVGEVVDVAVASGASTVLGVEFRVSAEREERLRRRALESAMATARARATTVAGTEGLVVADVRSIDTETGGGGPVFRTEASADAGTTIDPGPVSVEATVRVTYGARAS